MAYWQAPGGGQVYYEHHGGHRRPVMLIHGWAMNCRVWDTTVRMLRGRGHAVVAFDHRGCGRSDKDFATAGIDDLIGDAVGLVDALGLSGVVLNGWSLGGAVGVGAAAALGDRCAGVVLTCGASPRYTRTQDFPHGGTAEEVVQTVAAMTADRISFFHGLSRAVCARPVGQPVEDWLWSLFTGTAPAADQGLLDLADLDQREMIARLPVPLLSMVGTEDSFTPPDIGIAAAELAADGRLVRFQGCGHAPFIEAFDDYAAALVDFLESLD